MTGPVRPPRQPLDSLATKILLFVFASTLATAICVSVIAVRGTHLSLHRSLDDRYPAVLSQAAASLQAALDAAREELDSLEWEPEALARSKWLSGLARVDSRGRVTGAVGSGQRLAAEISRPAPAVSLASLSSGERALLVAAPAEAGRQRVGVFRSDALARLLVPGPPTGGRLLLIDGKGRRAFADPARARPVVPLAAGPEDAPALREYRNGQGMRMVAATRPLGVADLHLALATPFSIAFAPLISMVTRLFLVDLVTVMLVSLIAYRVTTAVVRPIEALSDGARRIAQGDFDLEIAEPRFQDEVGLLTRTFNDMMRQLRGYQHDIESKNRALEERNEELQRAKETFEQLSITDGLTKLHNHRFFQDHLTREIKRVTRTQESLSMLLVDLDDFKALNDRLGHAAGDELLMRIARIMEDSIRDSDLLARYGGEEFAVVASNTDLLGAYALAEKIRTAIAEESFILDDSLRPTRVTVSVGVAQYAGNRKKFFQVTDRALYSAKDRGKNCVVMAQDEYLA